MSLIERVEQTVDKKAAADLERKCGRKEFTLEDFRRSVEADSEDGAAGQNRGYAAENGTGCRIFQGLRKWTKGS